MQKKYTIGHGDYRCVLIFIGVHNHNERFRCIHNTGHAHTNNTCNDVFLFFLVVITNYINFCKVYANCCVCIACNY